MTILSKRERKCVVRSLKAEAPYLVEYFVRLEETAEGAERRATESINAAELRADAAERRERDTAREIGRLQRRVAELESIL